MREIQQVFGSPLYNGDLNPVNLNGLKLSSWLLVWISNGGKYGTKVACIWPIMWLLKINENQMPFEKKAQLSGIFGLVLKLCSGNFIGNCMSLSSMLSSTLWNIYCDQKWTKCLAGIQTQATSKSNSYENIQTIN